MHCLSSMMLSTSTRCEQAYTPIHPYACLGVFTPKSASVFLFVLYDCTLPCFACHCPSPVCSAVGNLQPGTSGSGSRLNCTLAHRTLITVPGWQRGLHCSWLMQC